MTKEELDVFLEELSVLTRKHGIVIGGCGCCNSPDLNDMTESERKIEWSYSATFNDAGYADSLWWSR